MTVFNSLYAKYYDLLYKDKDYTQEALYIHKIIKHFLPSAVDILELGCGTGKHAELLVDLGYKVHGVDMSQSMLELAEKRRYGKEDKLFFTHSKIQELNLDKKFDVVLSLFHVLSYQNSNFDVRSFFKTAKKHLKKGGIFIFDFWYGPSVLKIGPSVRLKEMIDDQVKVFRIAKPNVIVEKNVVEVVYNIIIKDLKSQSIMEKEEIHSMRFFFDPEVELFCELEGFSVNEKYAWLTFAKPTDEDWSVVWIVGDLG